MNEDYERFINFMIVLFNNFTKRGDGVWFLDGKSLVEFICNKRLGSKVRLGIVGCGENTFRERVSSFRTEVKKEGNNLFKVNVLLKYPVYVKLYPKEFKKYIVCKKDTAEKIRKRNSHMTPYGLWTYNLVPDKWYTLPVPYRAGGFLDDTRPLWFTQVKHEHQTEDKNAFFTPKRIGNALELMGLLYECAEAAGIRQWLFPGFGTLLGIIREGGFVQTDRDLDHCLMGNKITKEQEERFLIEIARERFIPDKEGKPVLYPKGLYEGRCRHPVRRRDNQRFLWTSCGHKKIHGQKGCKSCVWKFFVHGDFAWHSKGRKWINHKKFNAAKWKYKPTDEALCKGIKARYFDEFVEMKFKGLTINVPKLTGHCLDAWYPGWARPAKGASKKSNVLTIPKWDKVNTWHKS